MTLKWPMVPDFPNKYHLFIQPTAPIICVGIVCRLAVIIHSSRKRYRNSYLFCRIKSSYGRTVAIIQTSWDRVFSCFVDKEL